MCFTIVLLLPDWSAEPPSKDWQSGMLGFSISYVPRFEEAGFSCMRRRFGSKRSDGERSTKRERVIGYFCIDGSWIGTALTCHLCLASGLLGGWED